MSYTASVHHETKTDDGDTETGYVTLRFEGVSVSGGRKAKRYGPPSQCYPAESPDVTFDECAIEDDELNRHLDPITVFEAHDGHFCDRLTEEYGETMRDLKKHRNPPGV